MSTLSNLLRANSALVSLTVSAVLLRSVGSIMAITARQEMKRLVSVTAIR